MGAPRADDPRVAHRRSDGLRMPVSRAGLLGAIAGFALSLPPSLLPREPIMQGLLSGLLMAAGYGTGVATRWALRRLGVRRAPWPWLFATAGGLALVLALRWLPWQNEQRTEFGMPLLSLAAWPVVLLMAAAVATLAVLAGRGLMRLVARFRSPALGVAVATATASLVLAAAIGGLIAATTAFSDARDLGTTAGTVQTTSALRSGSAQSLVPWSSLGRKGRDFVAFGPTVEELQGSLEPIRVYVGRESAPTVQERAALAVAELQRTGAFDREVLMLAVPTGTGLVEPFSADALEYLNRGDTAIAAVAYSARPSWLSVVLDRAQARQTAQALFTQVYRVWQQIPSNDRPQLYLFGHSLGAYAWQPVVAAMPELPDPIDGALLAGPPFTGMINDPGLPGVTYLEHPSDPVVLVSAALAWQRPAWLDGQRLPDIAPQMRWLPFVTWLQVVADLPQAVFVPWGHGHMYSERDYLQGWSRGSQAPLDDLVERMRNDSSPVSEMLS